MILHAGLVAMRANGGWRGVLLRAPSGGGKSDLALRLLDRGFRLVADDRVLVWGSAGRGYGRAPDSLSDLIEVRGLGVEREACLPFARIVLVCDLASPDERAPEPEQVEIAGVLLPLCRIAPFEASAPARVIRAMARLGREGREA